MSNYNNYIITWTDIYGVKHKNNAQLKLKNEDHAAHAIPHGDILKEIDSIEDAIWDDKLKKFIPKPSPYINSKIPVIDNPTDQQLSDFLEYGYSSQIENGISPIIEEIHDFNTAYALGLKFLKIRPQTIIIKDDNNWYVGEISPLNKQAYFQGTEEPTPKKKKYKSDKAIVVQPRFKNQLFKNYDYIENPTGPGAGLYQNLDKYKSVSDFLKKKRERNKDKYEADDSWIEDDGKISKRKNKIKRRLALLSLAIDFKIDDQIQSGPILGDSGTVSDSVYVGGLMDTTFPLPDFEGKTPEQLNFGRDYVEDQVAAKDKTTKKPLDIEKLIGKYLRPHESGLYGFEDGNSPEDLDNPSNKHPQADLTNSEINIYDDKLI